MRASIIIVSYNGIAYLEKCLSSLIGEVEDDEVIIVDNASTDGSPELIQAHPSHPILICNQTNRGFAAACNQAAEAASGDYLVFLNQDTQVCSGWLAGLLVPLDKDPSIGLTTSRLLLMSQPERIQMCGQDVHFSGLVFGRGFLSPSNSFSEPALVGAVSGASFAIRRALWEQLFGFDERLYMYYEETDLSWRALLSGYSSLYTPDSTVYHDDRSFHPYSSTLYYSMRNRYILLCKNWRRSTLFLLFPSLLLVEFLDWFHAVLIGRVGLLAKFRASVWFLSHMPDLFEYHEKAQAMKNESNLALLDSCVEHLAPVEYKGGKSGRVLVSVCNPFFSLNAIFTRNLSRLLFR